MALVRPYKEHASSAWHFHLTKYIKQVEGVQGELHADYTLTNSYN